MKFSEVAFNKILNENTLFRFDAEYYSPEYVEAEKIVKSKPNQELRCLISVLTDYHANGSYETLRNNVQLLDDPDYALMIRTVDFERDDFEHDVKYISKAAYDFLKKTQIFGKEIIINKIGNAGKVYIVPPLKRKISLGMNQFMVRPNKEIVDGYLYVYLSCKYGSALLQQKITGAVPLSIDKESVRSVLVPKLDVEFQITIDNILNNHFDLSSQSKKLYSQAEQTLLSELGLLNWKPEHRVSFIRNFSDTKSSDRLDAEYFQPMYTDIENAVKSYKNGWDLVMKKFKPNKKTFAREANKVYKYVEIGCVKTAYGAIEPLTLFGYELPDNAKRKLSKNDVLVSKVRPYRGAIGIVESDDFVGSSAFTVLQESGDIFKETLIVLLRTKPYLEYSLKFNSGTSYPTISDDDILGFPIPLLPSTIQTAIKSKIQLASKTRNDSKALLEIAKHGVEKAIESNEQEAQKWIHQEVKNLCLTTT